MNVVYDSNGNVLSSTDREKRIADASSTIINPATEETLEAIADALGAPVVLPLLTLYGEDVAVAVSATATLIQYTVPSGKTLVVTHVEASGETIGLYTLAKNNITISIRRSNFANFNVDFFSEAGTPLTEGDILTLRVENTGSASGHFNGTIYGKLT